MRNRLALYRTIIFVAAIAVAIFFLPDRDRNSFTYEINRPWSYPMLTAPFDIPVYRDTTTVRQMRDSLEATFIPVFKRDETISRDLMRNLLAVEGIGPDERKRLRDAVSRIYADGVTDADSYAMIRSRKLDHIRYVDDNATTTRHRASKLRSPRVAYSRLDSMFRGTEVQKAMQRMELISKLVPNVTLDTAVNDRLHSKHLEIVDYPVGVIQQGERIINTGDIVTPQLEMILTTYQQKVDSRDETADRGRLFFVTGQVLFVFLLFGALYLYLYLFRRRIYDNIHHVAAIMSAVIGLYLIAIFMSSHLQSWIYMIPFAILPIMFVVFFDARTAFFCHVIEVLLVATMSSSSFEFIFLETTAGMAAIFSLKELTRRSQLLKTAVAVFLTYSVGYVAIELMMTGTLASTTWNLIMYFAINGILISFAYILIFVFEKLFGMTSMVSLVELSDINNKLLRELSEECPGTFQHSMSVSNLASDAARKIDANVLIVRAGALYHDIGKIKNPAFFTENQHGVNPHKALDPIQSARIIISHVTEGLKMAVKEKLPQVLSDMIAQHHGKGLAKYFYTTWCNTHPGEEADATPFTYPGPNPQSREASLLMMADSVEAASRSLSEHTTEAITDLVNRIVDGRVAAGLHNESPISFRDIKRIKEAFIQRLRSVYHVRIAYPKEIKPNTPQP